MAGVPRVVRSFVIRVRERGLAAAARVLRLTGAAVAAYLVALLFVTAQRPVTAALTALLVVQVTLVGTITDTIRRIVSVVAGVVLAIGVSNVVGLTWWSLAAIVAASIVVGQLLRLGPHLLEVPISA
ncbi:MAG: FUSC family protein, partial [Jatrophihabitantaceae bacterium]